jgi:hypothetical protein
MHSIAPEALIVMQAFGAPSVLPMAYLIVGYDILGECFAGPGLLPDSKGH